ncbi:OmpA family protein [Myroides odoratimimus]|uniref:OmpA family protein n=1 Tax=Myroides TaxID=76831 RepID=UPI0025762E8B|nr:OmpA family protein [Myroides odoratimimus]MDM1065470.1 OmpA family protein [Myroides odoratimimus]
MKKLQLITLGLSLFSFISVSAQKIEGKVFDKKTNNPIGEGEVTFFNSSGDRIATVYTSADGAYVFEPKRMTDIHKVSTAAKNYSKAEVLLNQMDNGVVANFGLTSVVSESQNRGNTIASGDYNTTRTSNVNYDSSTLPSFYYDFNSSYLNTDNKASVDEIVAYMYNNPEARVRVHVYFDTRGNAKYDEWLADRRADRVINYMVMKGISPSRLLKLVETVYQNVPPKEGSYRSGGSENRRCDFDLI